MGNKNGRFNRSQRMQMKAFICLLGFLLLFILLLVRLMLFVARPEELPQEEIHVPVIEVFTNVWIMEADPEKIMVFKDGAEETYYFEKTGNTLTETDAAASAETKTAAMREHIADIRLSDGKVTDIQVKREKINARLLSADATGVELEGYGKIPLASDYKGYRLYNTLEMCTTADLPFGYNFADYVIENGEICGILWAKEEPMEYIRVLLKASDYSGLLHDEVVLTSDCDFTIQYGTYDNMQTEAHVAGEEIVIGKDSGYFVGDRIIMKPSVLTGKIILSSVNRNQGIPGYRGHLELLKAADGIAVINEVLLEEYLYSVVPSEMPASYPEEALKAQAICARTYAYGHMLHAGYPQYGAHVDDSTSYQVYNNILEQESTTTAAKGTYGQLLYTGEGGIAGTYYYSTSCGVGSDANVWKTEAAKSITYLKARAVNESTMQALLQGTSEAITLENATENPESVTLGNDSMDIGELLRDETAFANFITSKNADDFEVEEGWYRWTYQVEEIDTEHMLGILRKRYQANEKLVLTLKDSEYVSEPITEMDYIKELYVENRGVGGVADALIIKTKKNTYKVISEHNIRYVLNNGESKVIRQDGSEIASPSLLPSAFFILEPILDEETVVGYTLTGGGFGHGVGMSQNAARNMAKKGYSAEQILLFFYEDCYLKNVYE